MQFNVEINQQELIHFAQQLVRIRSYSGEEGEIIHFIAAKMDELGYDEICIDSMGNLLGRIGTGKRSILFDSHVDTVAVTDEASWSVPPFSGAVIGGRLFGRGSVDMKSAAAASIYAAALAKKNNLAQDLSVYVSCTVLEEDCDGENLKHLFQEFNLRPDYAVICEPSNNQIALGHKGKAQIIIQTQGVSAHGSAPEKGVNAIYEMAEIIQRVEQVNRDLQSLPAPHGTLVLSRISSSSVSLNAVPSSCAIYLDRRLAPGETIEMVRSEMDGIVRGKQATWKVDHIRRKSWTGMQVEYEPLHQAWLMNNESKLVSMCNYGYAHYYGNTPSEYAFWDFSTNAVGTTRLGIPTIGFGPGDSKLAHMLDESLPVQQIVDACGFYMHLIQTLGEVN